MNVVLSGLDYSSNTQMNRWSTNHYKANGRRVEPKHGSRIHDLLSSHAGIYAWNKNMTPSRWSLIGNMPTEYPVQYVVCVLSIEQTLKGNEMTIKSPNNSQQVLRSHCFCAVLSVIHLCNFLRSGLVLLSCPKAISGVSKSSSYRWGV